MHGLDTEKGDIVIDTKNLAYVISTWLFHNKFGINSFPQRQSQGHTNSTSHVRVTHIDTLEGRKSLNEFL